MNRRGRFFMNQDQEKELVAKKAALLVKNGMKIGIGTGSTATFFIEALKKRIEAEKLDIACAFTSLKSKKLLENHVTLLDESLNESLDITFDGADRADPSTFYLIKGGGGALLREKLVAKCSKINVVLIDSSKLSTPLGGFPVAIEIVPFGYSSTIKRIKHLGYLGSLRKTKNGEIALSDNQNYIYDIDFKGNIPSPELHHSTLKQLLGVIETGFFLDTASIIYQGSKEGKVTILERP